MQQLLPLLVQAPAPPQVLRELLQRGGDVSATLEEFAENLRRGRSLDEKRESLLHTMACKAAIKGGWTSDPSELEALARRVQSGEVRFCPHGRPVAVKLTKYELEKMFGRA